MGFWFGFLIVIHVLLCLFLVLLILVQNDKGGGLAGAFGGMGGGAAFTGSSTATFLTKMTVGLAGVSFVVILGLNYLSSRSLNAGAQTSELKSKSRSLSSGIPTAPLSPSALPPGAIPGIQDGGAGANPVNPGSPAAGNPAAGGQTAP